MSNRKISTDYSRVLMYGIIISIKDYTIHCKCEYSQFNKTQKLSK